MKPRTASRRGETTLGVGILCVLALVAGGVYHRQFQFSPAILTPGSIAPAAAADLLAAAPGLVVLGPAETFGPDNLADKIDGKADLYLSAGFVELRCQRFADPARREAWFEVFRYDMGDGRNAFAVFSAQRRADARPLTVTALAYQTANALFFVAGRHYVELVAADASPAIQTAMLDAARAVAASLNSGTDALPELALFPVGGLQRDSVELLPADAFGCDRLNQVVTAKYGVAGGAATAFVSRRASAAEAATLAAAYVKFLVDNGGTATAVSGGPAGLQLVEILGTHEAVFVHGPVLAGVHAAPTKVAADQLARALAAHLETVRP